MLYTVGEAVAAVFCLRIMPFARRRSVMREGGWRMTLRVLERWRANR